MKYHILVIVLLMLSCSRTDTIKIDEKYMGFDYCPIQIGNWWVYKVDSVVFDIKGGGVQRDTISVTIREEITDTFPNSLNGMAYEIERSQLDDDGNWQIQNIWWLNKVEEMFLRTEDNLTFIKLVFPVQVNVSWDGNAFIDNRTEIIVRQDVLENTFVGWNYRYTHVDQTESINNETYEDVMTVDASLPQQIGDIQWRVTQEKYARGVGLIFKKWELLDIDSRLPNNLPVYERADEGFIMTQQLINYFVQ